MKHFFKLLSICLLAVSALQGQESNSLLWKIEGNNIQPAYLFGTFHLIPKDDFVFKDKVKDAMNNTDVTFLELDMDDPNLATEMQSLVTLQDGKQLQSFMDEKEYEVLDSFLKEKAGVGMQVFNTMKPMAINSIIMTALMGEQPASYEGEIIKHTLAQQKEILGLETMSYQMGIFDRFSYEGQIDQIIEFINDESNTTALMDKMIAIYKEEDVQKLYSFMEEFLTDDPKFQSALLDDRNKQWVNKIPELSKDQKVFYGVGAGHLGGKNGVLNLLKKQGFTVTPVLN